MANDPSPTTAPRRRASDRRPQPMVGPGARWAGLPDEIFELDGDDRVLDTNRADSDDAVDRIIGAALSGLLPVQHRGPLREACRQVRTTGRLEQFEAGGTGPRWWLYRVTPGAEPGHLLVSRTDITALKAGSSALAEDSDRYQLVFDASRVGMALTSVDGSFLMVNPALCSMLGYTEAELLATDIYAVTHPDDLAESATQARRLLTGKADSVVVDKRYFHRDGHVVWCRVSATATQDAAGETQYFVTQVQDISAWRQDHGDRLRHERQAFEAGRVGSLQALAGHVVDELDPLLDGLLRRVDAMQERLEEHHAAAPGLDDMRRSLAARAAFVHQLRTLARRGASVSAGMVTNLLVQAAADRARPRMTERSTLRLTLDDDLPVVHGDPGQVGLALDALLANAVEASTEEGEILVETRHLRLDEAHCREHPGLKPGSYVQVRVTDAGAGMSPEVQAQAFDPFFTTKSRSAHRGLGLPMALAVAQKHGGTLSTYSELSTGTSALLFLPAEHAAQPLERAIGAQGGETVLVAEDEESVSSVTRRLLERLGYRVLVAGDGVEALHMFVAARDQIDLVLLDMAMPRMGGPQAYERIRAVDRTVPIGFMTGYSAELALASLAHSTAVLITKPCSIEELGQVVREMLDQSPARE